MDERRMRKEIKRALLVWPLMASAAVTSIATVGSFPWKSTGWSIASRTPALIGHAGMLRHRIGVHGQELAARWDRGNTLGGWASGQWRSRDGRDSEVIALAPAMKRVVGRNKKAPIEPSVAVARLLSNDAWREQPLRAPRIDATRELAGLAVKALTSRSDSHPGSPPPLPPPLFSRELSPRDSAKDSSERSRHLPASIATLGKFVRDSLLPEVPVEPVPTTVSDTVDRQDGSPPAPSPSSQNAIAIDTGERVSDRPARASVKRKTSKPTRPTGWPIATGLHRKLESLSQIDDPTGSAEKWAASVDARLLELESLSFLGDARAGELLKELATYAAAGQRMAEASVNRELQQSWLLASHGLGRRLSVWGPIWKVVDAGKRQSIDGSAPTFSVMAGGRDQIAHAQRILRLAETLDRSLAASSDPEGWRQYLLLPEIRAAARSADAASRATTSQRFLSRLQWYGLHDSHRDWLTRPVVSELADALQTWTVEPIDYARLIRHLERQERNAIDLTSLEIADAVQSLRFSNHEASQAVADAIDTHYRNANLRFAISDEMLRRLLPPVPPTVKPVRTQLLGSRIIGSSHIDSDLDVRLVPSPDRWSMQLLSLGNVRTRSVGLRGPVAIRTGGASSFVSSTPIELLTNQVRVGATQVAVNNQNRLQGIRSDYDGMPLIGSLVRSIAASRFDESQSIANRIAERRIEQSVKREVDTKLQSELSEATRQVSDVVVGPIGRLGLEPKVMDMRTTHSRLSARYRIAGDWQMAAFTPRPRAPRDSLLSLQVHQSAINNTLEQLVPRDEARSVAGMLSDAWLRFGASQGDLGSDLPDDVFIQFAPTRPITVEIDDDALWLTLRIMQLSRDDSLNLSKVIVRAKYRGVAEGTTAKLVRDGSLQISGPRMSMRERLPTRAIFNRVLSEDRSIPITLPKLGDHTALQGLRLSQLELREGWIAIAMGEDRTRTASSPRTGQRK